MKKLLRSIQTYFPFLHDIRFKIEFTWLRIMRKPHEYDFWALKKFNLSENDVLIDIGTNRGESLLSMDIMMGNTNRIIGFEPNPHVYERAIKSIGFKRHIEVHNVGLANRSGNLELNIPFYRGWMFDGLSSFDYSSAHDWLENRLWGYSERNLHMKQLTCNVKRLDDYSLKPYFIKIDVQGLEFEVLKGAEKTIGRYKPILLIESIDELTINFLHHKDYQCYAYEFGAFKHGIGKLNTFCIPNEKLSTIRDVA